MNLQILLIAIPLLLAFLSLLLKKQSNNLLLVAGVMNVAFLTIIQKGTTVIGGFQPPFGITLVVDNYSFMALVVLNILFLTTILMSRNSIEEYGSVLLVAMAGLNGMILTGDIFNLFVFLEITSITAYILASKNNNYKNAFHYLVIGTLGSGLFLFGIALLYGMFGTLNMHDLSIRIADVDSAVIVLPTFMIFIGLAVESKLMPFSSWVKGVLGNADDIVAPLIAGSYAATSLFVFGRLFSQVLVIDSSLKILLLTITVVTLVLGEFAAFSKSKIKEILLFSSIGQAGLVATLFVSGLVLPAVLQLINNVFSKVVLFTITGKIAKDTDTDEIAELRGIFADHKIIGVSFTIASLSLLGLPLFFGFYSKINVMFGLFSLNIYLIPALILFSTIIEGAYFIRMLLNLWNTGEEGEKSKLEYKTDKIVSFSKYKKIGVLVISIVIVLMGIFPSLLLDNLYGDKTLLNENNPEYIFEIKGGM